MSETFAANLRAEMGRQNFHPEWLVERGAVNREPTPDEIDAIVLCLGVPESRLLVGREELEKEVADLKEEIRLLKIQAEAYTLVDWDLLMEDLEPTDLPNHRLVFGGGMGDKGTLSFQRSDQGLEIWIENYGDGLTYTMNECEEASLIAYLLG